MIPMRVLGKSNIPVSAIGMGCWAIGGPFRDTDGWIAYGEVDDGESIRAIHRALERGVNFFDTSDAYGCGRSERVLGAALKGRRDGVVIATKFGYVPDEEQRQIRGENATPAYIRQACEASLRRLQTDRIDLYQFHIHDYPLDRAAEVRDTLEDLVREGKIRWYGWSTVFPEAAEIFAQGEHCAAFQFGMNVFRQDPGMLEFCEAHGMAAILRGPLAMGILTGKVSAGTRFAENDMRHRWDLGSGVLALRLQQVEAVREILTRDGRSLAQGALGYLLARSPASLPIPGFKTVAQVEENAAALQAGPLTAGQLEEIAQALNAVNQPG